MAKSLVLNILFLQERRELQYSKYSHFSRNTHQNHCNYQKADAISFLLLDVFALFEKSIGQSINVDRQSQHHSIDLFLFIK